MQGHSLSSLFVLSDFVLCLVPFGVIPPAIRSTGSLARGSSSLPLHPRSASIQLTVSISCYKLHVLSDVFFISFHFFLNTTCWTKSLARQAHSLEHLPRPTQRVRVAHKSLCIFSDISFVYFRFLQGIYATGSHVLDPRSFVAVARSRLCSARPTVCATCNLLRLFSD